MSDPERLHPGTSRRALTEEAAAAFAELSQSLRLRGYEPEVVAHFVNRVVFCMFAEDIGLLPAGLFTRLLETAGESPNNFETMARVLFDAMAKGGLFGVESIKHFNGGLFDDDTALPLNRDEIAMALKAAARLVWESIPEQLRALGPEELTKRLDGFDWSHKFPHSEGAGIEASNGIFELGGLNRSRGATGCSGPSPTPGPRSREPHNPIDPHRQQHPPTHPRLCVRRA